MKIIIIVLFLLLSNCLEAKQYDVDTLVFNGSTDKLINIVVLGDGYIESELNSFVEHSQKFAQNFTDETPFKEYSKYFNVFIIKTASNISGAAMRPDSLIDNFYGSTFGYGGIDRLLVPTNYNALNTTLYENTPYYDQVIMLVNSEKYGGSGGWIATSSINSAAQEIVKHELGHSFAQLADEYYAGDNYAHEAINMSKETDSSKVRWKKWIGTDNVGIYQHCCDGNSSLWYKPSNICKMEALNNSFCPVCRQAIIERIYAYSSPIYDYFPKDSVLFLNKDSIALNIVKLQTTNNTLENSWYLNDMNIKNYHDTLIVNHDSILTGINNILCVVTDTSTYLRSDSAGSVISFSRLWKINNTPSGIDEISSNEYKVKIYPIPAIDYLNISIKSENIISNVEICLYNTNGQLLRKIANSDTKYIRIELNDIIDKVLLLDIKENGDTIYQNKIVKY